MICFITGGARSGKSTYAQRAALEQTSRPVFVATARFTENDTEFAERIQRHRNERNGQWLNYEEPLYVSSLPLKGEVVVIDCVTLWLSNFFSLHKMDTTLCLQSIKKEVDALAEMEGTFYIVSNEIGMGVHADTLIGRKFTDLQGWANQYIAQKAGNVTLMIAGIPLTIKNNTTGSI